MKPGSVHQKIVIGTERTLGKLAGYLDQYVIL
jgi:hypothetical protein